MKALKRIALMLTMIMTTALLYGCGSETPKEVVEQYFSKIQKGDTNVEKLFNMADDAGKEEATESDTMSEATQKKVMDKLKAIEYKVNSEEENGNTAKVNVTVKGMDFDIVFGKVMEEALGYMMEQAFSGKEMTEEESNTYFEELFNKYLEELTYSERTLDVTLTKVEDEWKIDEGETLSKLLMGIDSSTFKGLE